MKPAILVPYKNRRAYLDIFLDKVPKFLENINGIKDYVIYVAEQSSADIFNLALSRNVAAKFAIQDNAEIDYFIFHDVDAIPISNIDYGPEPFNVAWFLTAGGCKIFPDAFLRCNGYNPQFVGWGAEDSDFYERLMLFDCPVQSWHKTHKARQAVILNLEMPDLPTHEAEKWFQGYFGHSGDGPRFISPSQAYGGIVIDRHDKSDFLIPAQRQKNNELCDRIHRLSSLQKRQYIDTNGLNLVDLSKVSVKRRGDKVVWLIYDSTRTLLDPSKPNRQSATLTRQRIRAQQLQIDRRQH